MQGDQLVHLQSFGQAGAAGAVTPQTSFEISSCTKSFTAMAGELAEFFRTKTRKEWLELFEGSEACVEAVNSFEEMLAPPQVRARGYVREEGGKPVGMNSPFVFAPREAAPAPRLGEHTRQILGEAGLEQAEIEALLEKGVIGEA